MKNKNYWITNAVILTQDSVRTVKARANIFVRDGKIDKITQTSPNARQTKGCNVIEASGQVVLPGFVQAHMHLCQTLFRNQADDLDLLDWLAKKIWVYEGAHDEDSLFVSAAAGIYELLSSGTTCVLDMGTVRHTEAILKAVSVSGIRANVGKCLMDDPASCPPYLVEETEQALGEALALYKKWNGKHEDRIRVSLAPRFAISCTPKLLRSVGQLSRAHGILVHTHASESRGEIELVRARTHKDNIEYLRDLGLLSEKTVLAHCVWASKKEKKLLAKSGTHVAHCPSSNLKLASGIAPVCDYLAQGVNVAIGADGAPCNNGLSAFSEMRLAALLQKPFYGPRALGAVEALDLATRNGARALGWFDQIGSVEVGKRADLIAVDLASPTNHCGIDLESVKAGTLGIEKLASALVYSASASDLQWTMVDGRMLYKDGKVQTLSREWLKRAIPEALEKVVSRAARTTSEKRARPRRSAPRAGSRSKARAAVLVRTP